MKLLTYSVIGMLLSILALGSARSQSHANPLIDQDGASRCPAEVTGGSYNL